MDEKEKSRLLAIRKEKNRRRPVFLRQDGHKKLKLDKKWRKPKGLHSKMRHNIKGYRKNVDTGYRGPADVRGLHSSGLEIAMVANMKELTAADPKKNVVIVRAGVGKKNKILLFRKAKEMGLRVISIKYPDKFLKAAEEAMEKKKKEKESKKEEKKRKDEEKRKKADEKEAKEKKEKEESIDKVLTQEEKKEKEVLEAEKVLTKKE